MVAPSAGPSRTALGRGPVDARRASRGSGRCSPRRPWRARRADGRRRPAPSARRASCRGPSRRRSPSTRGGARLRGVETKLAVRDGDRVVRGVPVIEVSGGVQSGANPSAPMSRRTVPPCRWGRGPAHRRRCRGRPRRDPSGRRRYHRARRLEVVVASRRVDELRSAAVAKSSQPLPSASSPLCRGVGDRARVRGPVRVVDRVGDDARVERHRDVLEDDRPRPPTTVMFVAVKSPRVPPRRRRCRRRRCRRRRRSGRCSALRCVGVGDADAGVVPDDPVAAQGRAEARPG